MRRLIALLVALAVIIPFSTVFGSASSSLSEVGAQIDANTVELAKFKAAFCDEHPNNPNCVRATPTPIVTPQPTPTVTPTPAPTATPVPTPATACDATFGAPTGSDQSSAIASFLASHDGDVVCFTPAATYISQARIELDNWSGTILGQGATIKRTSGSATGSQFRFVQSENVVIDGLNVAGPATLSNIQNRVFGDGDQEDEHAFSVESTLGFTYRNSAVTGVWGDAVYLRARNSSGVDYATTNVVIDNVTANIIGRNCISVISAQHVSVSDVMCSNVSLHGFDAEPNRSTDIVDDVSISTSDWRNFDAGHTPSGPGYAIVLTPGYADVQVSNINIIANTMDNARVRVDGYDSAHRASNVTVTGNRPETSGAAEFNHIDGLTFSDNGLMTANKNDVN